DRYFYDTLVDVADGRGWGWISFLKLITPTPTLPVLVDAGPEQSYARKGEYSVEYLRGRWTAYQTVFPWVRAAVRLRNDDLAAAQAALRTVALERLDAALAPRRSVGTPLGCCGCWWTQASRRVRRTPSTGICSSISRERTACWCAPRNASRRWAFKSPSVSPQPWPASGSECALRSRWSGS